MTFAPGVPGVAAVCCCSVRCDWSARFSCPPLRVVGQAALSDTLPRNRYKASSGGKLVARAATRCGKSPRRARQWQRPQSADCGGTVPAKSSACLYAAAQMTTSRPIPTRLGPQRARACFPGAATDSLFLNPGGPGRQVDTVEREKPKIRVMPRSEVRSW